jgi:hypothetical protein
MASPSAPASSLSEHPGNRLDYVASPVFLGLLFGGFGALMGNSHREWKAVYPI